MRRPAGSDHAGAIRQIAGESDVTPSMRPEKPGNRLSLIVTNFYEAFPAGSKEHPSARRYPAEEFEAVFSTVKSMPGFVPVN